MPGQKLSRPIFLRSTLSLIIESIYTQQRLIIFIDPSENSEFNAALWKAFSSALLYQFYPLIHKFFPISPQVHPQHNVLDLEQKHIILCFTDLETIITELEKRI
jgi:hypothetical protein